MSHELVLTSVSQGLSNASGYCAVAENEGMPPALRKQLEKLSTYHHLQGNEVSSSPIIYAHWLITEGSHHVLSRIAPTGIDYRHQPNQLAHHIVPAENELVSEGPAWLCALPQFHLTEWKTPSVRFTQGCPIPQLTSPPSLTRRQSIARQQRYLDPQKMNFSGNPIQLEQLRTFIKDIDDQILMSKPPSSPCPVWQKAVGDAGWAGLLAASVQDNQKAVILFRPDQHILPLFVEAVSLLPPDLRWQATFCTYAVEEFPSSVVCQWLGVLADSSWANELRRDKNRLIIDLTVSTCSFPYGPFVDFARSGADRDLHEDAEQTKIILDDDIPTPKPGIYPPIDDAFEDKRPKHIADSAAAHVPPSLPPMLPSQPFIIESREPKISWLNGILTMKGRKQFYLLYGTTILLLLFLLLLVIDQASGWGIANRFINGKVPSGSPQTLEKEPKKLNTQEPHVPIPSLQPDSDVPSIVVEEPETVLQPLFASPEEKEKLAEYLAKQELPEALPMPVPMVDAQGSVSPPSSVVFNELAGLFPHTAALELRFQPLFTIPQIIVETQKENSEENNEEKESLKTFWRVYAQDTVTQNKTPMFRFTLSDQGLIVDWERDGMESQYLYDTILLSLGFLDIFVTEQPGTVKTVPLFVPKKVPAVRFPLPSSVEMPFAVEPWKSVLADPRFAGLFSLHLKAEIVSWSKPGSVPPSFAGIESIKTDSTEPSRFVAVFETTVEYSQPNEDGSETYIPITQSVEGTAALDTIVWRDDYEEQIQKQKEELEENNGILMEKEQQLNKIRRDFANTEERQQLENENKLLKNRITGQKNWRAKVDAAHQVLVENAGIGLKYSVFLLPADAKTERDAVHKMLLLLQSE